MAVLEKLESDPSAFDEASGQHPGHPSNRSQQCTVSLLPRRERGRGSGGSSYGLLALGQWSVEISACDAESRRRLWPTHMYGPRRPAGPWTIAKFAAARSMSSTTPAGPSKNVLTSVCF